MINEEGDEDIESEKNEPIQIVDEDEQFELEDDDDEDSGE